jgi:hypothetical protein
MAERWTWWATAVVVAAGVVGMAPSVALAGSSVWSAAAALPDSVSRPGVASVGQTVYAVGGDRVFLPPSEAVYAYSTATNAWSARASLPAGAADPMAVSLGGYVYLLNGQSADGAAVSLRYSPTANRWTRISTMPTTAPGVAASTDDGRIFVATTTHLYRYAAATNTWKTLPVPVPSGISLNTAVVGADGRLYVFGDRSYAWTSSAGWQRLPDIPVRYVGVDGLLHLTATRMTLGRLLVVGGTYSDPFGNAYSGGNVWVYQPTSRTWTVGESQGSAGLGANSAGAGAAVVGHDTYFVGGDSYADLPGDAVRVMRQTDVGPPEVMTPTYPTIARYLPSNFGGATQIGPSGAIPVAPIGAAADAGSLVTWQNGWYRPDGGTYRNEGWFFAGMSPSGAAPGAHLTPGHTGQWESRWTDSLGNASGFSISPRFGASVIDDSSTNVSYQGTWRTSDRVGAMRSPLDGTVHITTTVGDSAALQFTGRSVAYVTPQPGYRIGEATVYIDGRRAATVYLSPEDYFVTPKNRAVVFVRTWRQVGTHTIRIVALGGTVTLDGFAILS